MAREIRVKRTRIALTGSILIAVVHSALIHAPVRGQWGKAIPSSRQSRRMENSKGVHGQRRGLTRWLCCGSNSIFKDQPRATVLSDRQSMLHARLEDVAGELAKEVEPHQDLRRRLLHHRCVAAIGPSLGSEAGTRS